MFYKLHHVGELVSQLLLLYFAIFYGGSGLGSVAVSGFMGHRCV
jgi:hypothetical protein